MKGWKFFLVTNLVGVNLYASDIILPVSLSSSDSLKDTCTINFSKGLDSVYLGKTKLKNVKKIYGKVKAQKDKTFFDLMLGLYNVTVVLSYPSIGLEFIYDSTLDRLTRIFRPKKVNVIHVLENCSCKTDKGIGIGSTYNDIEAAFNVAISMKGVSSDKIYSEVVVEVPLPSGKHVFIKFISNHVKNKDEFIVKEIKYFIRK
jgi:hypothetical protein